MYSQKGFNCSSLTTLDWSIWESVTSLEENSLDFPLNFGLGRLRNFLGHKSGSPVGELAQNASENLVLELLQSQSILLGRNQSAPVVGQEFLLTQPVGVMERENYVVGIARGG